MNVCDPDAVTAITVTQAGAAEWNGVYTRSADIGDGAAFMKDDTHEIYKSGNVWRLADYGASQPQHCLWHLLTRRTA